MDPDILSAVLGRAVAEGDLRSATALDFKRVRIEGVTYPALLPEKGRSAQGILVENLDERDVALLAAYEGASYDDQPIDVTTQDGARVAARYWRWIGKRAISDQPWDFDEWRRKGKPRLLVAAKAVGRSR